MSRSESLKAYWKSIKSDPKSLAARGKRGPSRPLEDRFWEKVDKSAGIDSCWLWTAATLTEPNLPYGVLQVGGRLKRAHRVSYELEHGPITRMDCVLHSCDNPRCVNPSHLFLGNKTSNAKDRDSKGRQAKGEDQGMSKLSSVDASAIRSMYETGRWSQKSLAEEFGVSQQTISDLLRGRTWKHVQ